MGVDQIMAAQLRAIELGMEPKHAYDNYRTIPRDSKTMQLILDAVLDLWRGTAEHCRLLEEKLVNQS